MGSILRRLAKRDDGAVAPTVALSLFALVAAGGVAFDYARMASLDTELQNAADQAALAAASQLTSDAGACARAARAAGGAVGGTDALVVNSSLLANDGDSVTVTTDSDPAVTGGEDELQCNSTGNIRFYQDIARTPATGDADAKFVEVRVNPRTAFYALTPVVGAFQSGPMVAIAFASLGEAYCKVPPVMICNPTELTNDGEFDFEGLAGAGLSLVSVGSGGGSWAPGNFGYLDMPGLSEGANGLREGLGWGTPPINCIATSGLDTKPGATVDVVDSINTRFDIYDGPACQAGSSCPASINSVKDLVRSFNAGTNGNGCRVHNSGWGKEETGTGYYGFNVPTTNAALPDTVTPTAMGHPRDICHAVSENGVCPDGRVGDGNWDRDAYFRTNYIRSTVGVDGELPGTRWTHDDWMEATGLPADATRYAVYVWEIENRYTAPGDEVDGVRVLAATPPTATGAAKIATGTPVCSPAQTDGGVSFGPGWTPGPTTPDRRKISVAVVNCVEQGVNGSSSGLQTVGFLEAFLVEPSIARARNNRGDIYVEVVGASTTGVQLVSKKVPYLIE